MTISPNGTFSAAWSSQTHTSVLKGTQVFRAIDKVLVIYPDNPADSPTGRQINLRIMHVDEHTLIYEFDNQTNSMSR